MAQLTTSPDDVVDEILRKTVAWMAHSMDFISVDKLAINLISGVLFDLCERVAHRAKHNAHAGGRSQVNLVDMVRALDACGFSVDQKIRPLRSLRVNGPLPLSLPRQASTWFSRPESLSKGEIPEEEEDEAFMKQSFMESAPPVALLNTLLALETEQPDRDRLLQALQRNVSQADIPAYLPMLPSYSMIETPKYSIPSGLTEDCKPTGLVSSFLPAHHMPGETSGNDSGTSRMNNPDVSVGAHRPQEPPEQLSADPLMNMDLRSARLANHLDSRLLEQRLYAQMLLPTLAEGPPEIITVTPPIDQSDEPPQPFIASPPGSVME